MRIMSVVRLRIGLLGQGDFAFGGQIPPLNYGRCSASSADPYFRDISPACRLSPRIWQIMENKLDFAFFFEYILPVQKQTGVNLNEHAFQKL